VSAQGIPFSRSGNGDRMFAFGLLAALAASLLFNAGMALQALEARRTPRELALKPSLLGRLLRRPLWLVGSVLGLVGIAPQVAALAWAPFVVVQTALAAGLLVLLVLGVRTLHERVSWWEIGGVAAMIAGIACVAYGSPEHVEQHRGGLAVILVVGGLTLAAVTPWLLHAVGIETALAVILASGAGFAASNVATKLASDDVGLGHWWNGAAWAVVVVATGLAAVITQMTAFQLRAATVVIPIGFAVQTFLPIVLEPFFLREHTNGAIGYGVPVLAGLALLLVGTVLVGRNQGVAELAAGAQS
jgi:drug/metabolite transporter (DMT)-like permease